LVNNSLQLRANKYSNDMIEGFGKRSQKTKKGGFGIWVKEKHGNFFRSMQTHDAETLLV